MSASDDYILNKYVNVKYWIILLNFSVVNLKFFKQIPNTRISL